MKIAVLGWGSLIWDQKKLKVSQDWKNDGPILPIEFARISSNSRLTLVLKNNAKQVQVLWNYIDTEDFNVARENLREREDTPNIERIGFVNIMNNTKTNRNENITRLIIEWAKKKELDAVIWTDLGTKFKDKINLKLNLENIISYLGSLPPDKQELAKEYFVKAPEQIKTEYRNDIQETLNWKKREQHRNRVDGSEQ